GGDYLVAKYDLNLNLLSTATFNGAANGADHAMSIAVLNSSSVYTTGVVYNGSNYDAVTVKLDLSSGSAGGGGSTTTLLSPVFSNVRSSSFSVTWINVPSANFTAVLSTN